MYGRTEVRPCSQSPIGEQNHFKSMDEIKLNSLGDVFGFISVEPEHTQDSVIIKKIFSVTEVIEIQKDKETIISLLKNNDNLFLWLQNWLDAKRYHCCHCGKDKIPTSFYYVKKNWVYPDGRIPVCKKCLNKMFYYYNGKYGDEYKAMNKICQLFDIYFDTRLFKTVIADDSVVGRYLQRLNLRQNKYKLGKGYDGSYLKTNT